MKQEFKIDNCEYCKCLTRFESNNIAEAIEMLENGELWCDNCGEENLHKKFNIYWKNYCNGQWEIIYNGSDCRKREKGEEDGII